MLQAWVCAAFFIRPAFGRDGDVPTVSQNNLRIYTATDSWVQTVWQSARSNTKNVVLHWMRPGKDRQSVQDITDWFVEDVGARRLSNGVSLLLVDMREGLGERWRATDVDAALHASEGFATPRKYALHVGSFFLAIEWFHSPHQNADYFLRRVPGFPPRPGVMQYDTDTSKDIKGIFDFPPG